MNPRTLRAALGLFVVISGGLLLALLALFGSLPTWWTYPNRYTVLLPRAPGVGLKMPVRRSGVRIGAVEQVELEEETGKVRVTIGLERKHLLRQDDLPVLVRAFPSEVSLDILPRPAPPGGPQPGHDPVPLGGEVVGAVQPDALARLNQAAEL